MSATREWAEHPELVAYYTSHRSTPEELYPSEERFLPDLARGARRVLDVGCGAGGFAAVWSHFNPELEYVGVDTSAALVDAARQSHPGMRFEHADAVSGLPFPDGFADVVAALGWLHWEHEHERALRELWRVAGERLFFDVRLHDRNADEVGEQRLALVGDWDGRTTVPYVALAWPAFARALSELRPRRILANGYWGSPAATVRGVQEPVCFATFVLERTASGPGLELDLPLGWPADLEPPG